MNESLPPARRDVSAQTALLLLIGGGAAWIIALAAVLWVVLGDDDAPAPTQPPVQVVDQPTLAAALATPAPTATLLPSDTPAPTIPPAPTQTAAPTTTEVSAVPPTTPPTILPATPADTDSALTAAGCPVPSGWERYIVQPDDTLFAFALGSGGSVTVDQLMIANCLSSRYLAVDQVLYLPPGAAENAPPSAPVISAPVGGATGPRAPNCPCVIAVAEGWRREQIADAINAAQTTFTGADFLAVTGPGASAPFDFVMDRPGGTSLEGFLFPGTYTVQNDTTAEGFRDMLIAAFGANVSPQVRADAAAQGVTFYQALIIASIVQRETRGPETQKLTASVYYNRFRDGNRLGTTVSVQYALGAPGNWWPRVTQSGLQVDSPYNTYNRAGLPPTPIDSPGLSAILGTVYAPRTEYRFHTAACDGSGEVFAVTYEEHLANVNCE
jgi:hypothetical protein